MPAPAARMSASCRRDRGPTRPANAPEQVRDERRGGERGQTDRVEAAAAGDGRQERRDQRDRHADADRRDRVEREVAPDRALMRRRGAERWPEHGVPRSSPSGLRGELSGSALGSPSRSSRFAPGCVGPPSSRGRFGHGNDSSEGAAAAMADWSGVRRVSVRVPGSASARRRGRPAPVRIGLDRAVGGLSVRFRPDGEEGGPSWRDDPGVLARAIGDKAVATASRVPGSGAVRMLIHHVRLQSLVGRGPLGFDAVTVRASRLQMHPFRAVRPRDRPTAGDARATIRGPSRFSDLWGCVVSTGPGYRGTRAEDATGPR